MLSHNPVFRSNRLSGLAMLHESQDAHQKFRVRKEIQISVRVGVGIFLILMGLTPSTLPPLGLLGIFAFMVLFLVQLET